MSGHEIRSVGTTVGTIGATAVATVDERGVVDLGASGVGVEWSVKAEHWRRAARVPGVRQQIEVGAPVVTTRMAVAGGDVVQRVYGVAGAVPYVVVEFENASADAVVLAVGLGTSTPPRRRSLDVDGGTVSVDGHDVLFASRPWAQWATAADLDGVMQLVESEATRRDAFVAPTGRHGDSAAVFVWPLAHRTTLRLALALGPTRPGALGAVDLAGAPSADDVALGWDRQLDRAMRIELDDRVVADAAQAARAALLLRVGADRPRPDATTAVALEDWGFDTEAVEVWQRLSVRSRRAARRRRRSATPWTALSATLPSTGEVPGEPAALLMALRDVLLHEHDDGTIEILPGFPTEWLGLGVVVHDAPTRRGLVSFAVRWHGGRPALLWDIPADSTVVAPVLDPSFRGRGGSGEQLLAEPDVGLLDLHKSERLGVRLDEPGSFD